MTAQGNIAQVTSKLCKKSKTFFHQRDHKGKYVICTYSDGHVRQHPRNCRSNKTQIWYIPMILFFENAWSLFLLGKCIQSTALQSTCDTKKHTLTYKFALATDATESKATEWITWASRGTPAR